MFEGTILTFNPGVGQDMSEPESFADVRDIQSALQEAGIELGETADGSTTGPAPIDPDGNAILVDQFR